jgi:threonine 3-dehydrogenase
MSGKPAALREMLAIMMHGGKIAMLGLPAEDFGID